MSVRTSSAMSHGNLAGAGVEAIAWDYAYAKPMARCGYATVMPDDVKVEDICRPCLSEERSARKH